MALRSWLPRVFSSGSNKEPNGELPQEDWIVFARDLETGGGVISADRSITSGHWDTVTTCLKLAYCFSAKQLQKNGMPESGPATRYFELEDKICAAGGPSAFRVAASRTGAGKREVWFCGGQQALPPNADEIASAYPEFQLSFSKASMAEVRRLHPTRLEAQIATNHRLFQELAEAGDRLLTPRRIDHWIYQVPRPKLNETISALRAHGYEVDEASFEAIRFHRTRSIDLADFDIETRQLNELCDSLGCRYDGWATSVVRS